MKLLNFFKNILDNKSTDIKETQNRYLDVPYAEKDIAKKMGAKWDSSQKKWFIPQGMDESLFERWLPYVTENLKANYFYLAQTQEKCFKCHQLTEVNAIVLPEGFESLEEESENGGETSLSFYPQDFPSLLSYVSYISPEALSEIKKYTSNYNLQYSKTISATYFRTKCQHCPFYQGDHYTMNEHDAPFSPVNTGDFTRITFHKIPVPIGVYAAGWSIDYPPLQYYLGDESANGMFYARNI